MLIFKFFKTSFKKIYNTIKDKIVKFTNRLKKNKKDIQIMNKQLIIKKDINRNFSSFILLENIKSWFYNIYYNFQFDYYSFLLINKQLNIRLLKKNEELSLDDTCIILNFIKVNSFKSQAVIDLENINYSDNLKIICKQKLDYVVYAWGHVYCTTEEHGFYLEQERINFKAHRVCNEDDWVTFLYGIISELQNKYNIVKLHTIYIEIYNKKILIS